MARTRTATARPRIDSPVGARIRELRTRAGLTQAQVAAGRYTSAYISALENGLVRPSLAALTHIARRLEVGVDVLLRERNGSWERLEADLRLASGDWLGALDRYSDLLDGSISRSDAALVRRGRAEALCRLGRPREALADAAIAFETLAEAGQAAESAYAGYWVAFANYQLDNIVEARAIAHQLLAEVRAGLQVQDDFKLRLLVALGMIESWDGQHERALAFLEEARSLTDEMDDQRRARFLFTLAQSYAASGDQEAALRNGAQALALFESTGSELEAGTLRNTMAFAHLRAGNLARAAEYAEQARHIVEQLDDRRQLAHVAETQAQIALANDDEQAMNEYALEALDLARSVGDGHAEAAALLTLARARRRTDAAAAEATYAQTATLLRRVGPRRHLQELLREWAELLVSQDRHQEAVALLQEALTPDD
jgi:transcriptional regulator with XRE-family HTH domain